MPRREEVCKRAIRGIVEQLEGRVLLTTLTGGGVDPITHEPIVTAFSYRDAHDKLATIFVGGNTTAEFLTARVTGTTMRLGNPALYPPSAGQDLFSIYVTASDQNSFIAVSEFDPNTGNLIPFNGNSGPTRIRNAITGVSTVVNPDDATGELILGARTNAPAPADNIPILSRSTSVALGVHPAGRVLAGLTIAPGLDFGKFLFAGTVFGSVTAGGSMESFYAGNVWTGGTRGIPLGLQTISRGKRVTNFTVAGDLHSLFVTGSIGTNSDAALDRPVYDSGFDMLVGGQLGEVHAAIGDVMGGINAVHGPAISPFGSTVQELEGLNVQSAGGASAEDWARGNLEGSPNTLNDTFNTPQILPSFLGRKHRSNVVVAGQLQADPVVGDFSDYYGVAMLAGQDLTVQLRPTGTLAGVNNMNVAVFDPDGRIIASDYPNVPAVNAQAVTGQPVHFTADRPGLYRIAVSATGDPTFTNGGVPIGTSPYVLTINGGGDLGLGGVFAGRNIFDAQAGGYGIFVQNGDLGALEAGGVILSITDATFIVRKGNLRGIEGARIGLTQANPASPNLFVTRGFVGLVRSTASNLYLNENVVPMPVGGDYQVVSAATQLGADLEANRAIGVIRAGDMATSLFASNFVVNADQEGDDGIIDLIDVAGNMGTLAAGGPSITTGPGGNVRYINVTGTLFRDAFFGGNAGEPTVLDSGQSTRIQDDSGTLIDIVPFPVATNPLFVPGGTNPATIGPTVTYRSYPIRGSGGAAIVDVTSTGSIRIGAGAGIGSKAHAEIGLLASTGAGNPVIRSTNTGTLQFSLSTNQFDPTGVNKDILIDGSGTVDVYKVQGADTTSIQNRTSGEILNVDAQGGTIGVLGATNIGVGVKHTGAAVNGIQVIGNAYPFNQQHNGVVSGNILNVESSGAIGNLNVTGDIGNLVANSGGRHSTGTFEGIAGPIVANGTAINQGNIDNVDIGDGILPSGSGNVSFAGIYAAGRIGNVVNRGAGSDVRGDIISQSNIASVSLSDGAIIGAKIFVVNTFAAGERLPVGSFLPDNGDTTSTPSFEIGEIRVSGQGGIIGSEISAADIGPISVSGFGIINSQIDASGDGTIASINAGGYGIRTSSLEAAFLPSVSASARPKNISTLNYTESVRLSERYTIDPFFDQAPSVETDLHVALGTSARKPQVKRVTDSGVIADTAIRSGRTAGTIFASQVRSSQFNIANQVGRIETRGVIEGLNLTTGRLKNFLTGSSVSGLNFQVAGPIESFRVVGDVDETSRIQALGPSANIIDFIVDGSLAGDVTSANTLHLLAVGRYVTETSLVKAKKLDIQQVKRGVFGTIQIG